MSSKNNGTFIVGMKTALGTGVVLVGATIAGRYFEEHRYDEKGVIIGKANKELVVDIKGDNEPERVIVFNKFDVCYDYAQPGDKISYTNQYDKSVVDIQMGKNKIRTINGKDRTEIHKWQELNKHVKTKTR